MAVANHVLVGVDDYGESLESIEGDWDTWLHHLPFDADVARALGRLYDRRLAKLDAKKDAADYERLERKLRLVRARAARYDITRF